MHLEGAALGSGTSRFLEDEQSIGSHREVAPGSIWVWVPESTAFLNLVAPIDVKARGQAPLILKLFRELETRLQSQEFSKFALESAEHEPVDEVYTRDTLWIGESRLAVARRCSGVVWIGWTVLD